MFVHDTSVHMRKERRKCTTRTMVRVFSSGDFLIRVLVSALLLPCLTSNERIKLFSFRFLSHSFFISLFSSLSLYLSLFLLMLFIRSSLSRVAARSNKRTPAHVFILFFNNLPLPLRAHARAFVRVCVCVSMLQSSRMRSVA